MARVAVLIDRAPDDPEWKGAIGWALIDALAESQHELQVFTPLSPARLPKVHARVNVARPAPSFGVTHLLAWSRALVQFRPDVIHTLAPKDESRFANLTCWPWLEALKPILAHTRRVATLFDATDAARSSAKWLATHSRWTVFDRDLTSTPGFSGEIDVLDELDFVPRYEPRAESSVTLVPASIDEWVDLERGLDALTRRLNEDPEGRVRVVGGWGAVELDRRRAAWSRLGGLAARVEMSAPRSLAEFVADASIAKEIWWQPLGPGSWRSRLARGIAEGRRGSGESANLLSRIYSSPGRW